MATKEVVVRPLSAQERAQLDAAVLAHGLDPMDFRADVVEYPPPSYGPTICHVRLVARDVESVLWSEPGMSWLDRLKQQLEAGLFDEGGAARIFEALHTLAPPCEVGLVKTSRERCGR